MFIRYYLDLALPIEDAEASLLRSPRTWLPGMAERADARGERLLAEVGFGRSGHRLDKMVEITLGEPVRLGATTLLPLSWKATGPERVFPELEADIELAGLGRDRTQLAISARYRPPLGTMGEFLDRALLHRIAEATLKDFLDHVGEALLRPADAEVAVTG